MAATLPTSNCGKAIGDVGNGEVSFVILRILRILRIPIIFTWSISSVFRGDVTPSCVGKPPHSLANSTQMRNIGLIGYLE